MEIPKEHERTLIEQRELALSPFSGEAVKERAWVVIDFVLDLVLELEKLSGEV